MKNKNIRKNMSSQHRHEHQSNPPKENIATSKIKFGDTVFLVEKDEYSAIVRETGQEDVIGLFKAATRTWKINNLPLFVQSEVEALY